MIRLYDYLPSGNGYKVRLLLHQLEIPFDLVEMDIVHGATRTPEYLTMNANGRIPLVCLDDGTYLAESNAITFYFAEGTPFLPEGRRAHAEVLQWMFFEQYSHEPNIATRRAWLLHPEWLTEERRPLLPSKLEQGYAALSVMEKHLETHTFLVRNQYSIADIALYAYTHVADEGEYDMHRYPAIRTWLDRVKSQPRYIPITWRL